MRGRLEERIRAWRVAVDRVVETETSLLAFGHRDRQAVVLKLIRTAGEEWRSGHVLEAFGGRGVVRALDHVDGAVLLERLVPGESLAAAGGMDDEEATGILADVIGRMSPAPPPHGVPTVEAWGASFERYAASGDGAVARPLVEAARRTHARLCASQSDTRLLHGDLHHFNVLRDAKRGWLAIDPKGVVGELACEVGAALRNPCDQPALFAAPAVVTRRVGRFARALRLDPDRILGWAFAQAVLAALWDIEDHGGLDAGAGFIALANALRPMLKDEVQGTPLPRSRRGG